MHSHHSPHIRCRDDIFVLAPPVNIRADFTSLHGGDGKLRNGLGLSNKA